MSDQRRTAEADREPRDSRVVAEPATVERCAEDYANGASTREDVFDNWSQQNR